MILSERLDKFQGYVAIRPLLKKLSSKKINQLNSSINDYVSDTKKSYPTWRFLSYLTSKKVYTPWISCNDLIEEILQRNGCFFNTNRIFPWNQNDSHTFFSELPSNYCND